MTLTDAFWIAVTIGIVLALLVSLTWHRDNRRERLSDDHVYQDRRAEIRAQLAKLQQAPLGESEEHRQRFAHGKTPAVKGSDAFRHGRRRSS